MSRDLDVGQGLYVRPRQHSLFSALRLNRELLALRQCGTQKQNEQQVWKESVLHESNPQDHYFGSLYEGCGSLSPL